MSFAAVATGVAGLVSAGVGVAKLVQGRRAAKEAKTAADEARIEMDKQKEAFQQLDTSNPYLNMENTMEDLTVDQRAAEFAQQGALQSQANVMDKMRGAAGASGIAALAQSMANQGSMDAQKAATSIAEQEAANQKAERAETSRLQGLEKQGEMQKRQMEQAKIDALMGMAAGDVSSAEGLRTAAMTQQGSAMDDIAGGLTSAAGAVG
jgi:hypothetical protein